MALGPSPYRATVGSTPQAPDQQGQGPAQPNSFTNALRNEQRRNAQQVIDYDPRYQNIYEDQTLQSLGLNGDNSNESNAYYRDHAAQYGVRFLEETKLAKMGGFYNRYQQILLHYGKMNGENSQAKQEFAVLIQKRIDFSNRILTNVSIWFSRIMMEAIKRSQTNGNMSVPPNVMFNALDAAVLNILNLEIVAWLHGSSKAKHFLYNQSPDITHLLDTFQKRKEIAAAHWTMFDEQSPYDAMDFSKQGDSENQGAQIYPEFAEMGLSQIIDSPESRYRGNQELFELPYQMARANNNQRNYEPEPPANRGYAETYYGPNGTMRTDLENLRPDNVRHYDIKSYFKRTCLSNCFSVNEADWHYIKHVLKRDPKQRNEETLFEGCVRLIKYDFEEPDTFPGWCSRSIRFTGMDKDMILSDPTKLIPLLEDESIEEQINDSKVNVLDAKSFFDRDKDDENMRNVDDQFAQLREAYYNYHVITNTDEMVSSNSKEIIERITASAKVYASDTTRPIALLGGFDVKDRYMVPDVLKRDLIFKRLPVLFKDNDLINDMSYFNAIEYIRRNLAATQFDDKNSDVKDNFEAFLRQRLTTDFNNWLIHSCGYLPKHIAGPHLDVTDILDDLDDLKSYLLKNDKVVYDLLNRVGESVTITSQLCLFDAISELPEGTDIITVKEHEMTLVRSKNYNYITVCNERGPELTKDIPIVVRRSNKPELFLLLDELNKGLIAKGKDINNTTIMLRFDMNGGLFLVSYSAYDTNVVTLRSIIPQRTLLNPLYG